jgi:predicted ester cyclase
MSAKDIAMAGVRAFEAHDFTKAAGLLSEDLVFTGPTPQPLGKREYVGVQTALINALPDWKFNAQDFKEEGDRVTVPIRISGTHTGALNLPMPGIPPLPPTGKHVQLPEEHVVFTVKDNKISRIETDQVPGAGVPGLLSQLGVHLPPM